MTSESLWKLFFQTGLPTAYCLSKDLGRRESEGTKEKGEAYAAHHPGHRPAGDPLQRGG